MGMATQPQEAMPSVNPRRQAVVRLLRNRKAMFGLFCLTIITLSAVFAPFITTHDPDRQNVRNRLKGSSAEHWLGTDYLGRDVFARIVYGGRVSLQVGFVAVGIALVFGGTMGLLAGYYGGWLESFIMRVVDILLALPGFLLALAIIATLGSSITNVMIAVGIAYSPGLARVTRSAVIAVTQFEYVTAARAAGAGDFRIIWRHILPNSTGPIIVQTTLSMAGAILSAAALSYLGLGVQPPTAEWGSMLNNARQFYTVAPHAVAYPGLAIMITVLSLNLLGDGLRDAFDPRMKS